MFYPAASILPDIRQPHDRFVHMIEGEIEMVSRIRQHPEDTHPPAG
jgi:hypothetical protein